MKYYAHYNEDNSQYLRDHLQNVSKRAIQKLSPSVDFGNIGSSQIAQNIKIISLYHDFGKYLSVFQDYLINGKKSKYKDHAHISAMLVYLILSKKYKGDRNNTQNLCSNFLSYLCVRLHHGRLKLEVSLDDEIFLYLNKQAELLNKDFEQIKKDISRVWKEEIDIEEILEVHKLKEDDFFMGMKSRIKSRMKDERWFFMLLYMFSILIDSDKMDSADIDIKKQLGFKISLVDDYIKSKSSENKINQKRHTARLTIKNTLKNLSDKEIIQNYIYTITAPTGIGKTLSSLDSAIYLADRIERIYGYKSSIIGAIPFINIIEQTRIDYEAIFGDRVIVNHGLEELFEKEDNQNSYKSLEETLLKVEAWDEEVVLTTFVQFFHSIFTGRNKPLKKFNKISKSIVILDEIQAIPEIYMPLIACVIHYMGKFLGVKFILMTATKPKIIEFGNKLISPKETIKSLELLADYKDYFKDLNRTRLIPYLDSKIDIEELKSLVLIKSKGEDFVLVVVNTIKSSISLYEEIKKDQDKEVLYLSTNIIPKKRREVINNAKEYIKNKVPFIMISTQTIEAGVDLDFDIAFRDMSPISSIIQVAGRVNREGKKNIKDVYIFELKRDSKMVYELYKLDNTSKLLNNKGIIHESDYQDLVDEYYDSLLQSPVSNESERIWKEGILKLDFDVIEEFELIKSDGQIMDVFVELDKEASDLADEYEDLMKQIKMFRNQKNKDYYYFNGLLKNLRRKMSVYMVSLRVSRLKENLPEKFYARNEVEGEFLWVPTQEINRLYDQDTGYRFENDDVLIF